MYPVTTVLPNPLTKLTQTQPRGKQLVHRSTQLRARKCINRATLPSKPRTNPHTPIHNSHLQSLPRPSSPRSRLNFRLHSLQNALLGRPVDKPRTDHHDQLPQIRQTRQTMQRPLLQRLFRSWLCRESAFPLADSTFGFLHHSLLASVATIVRGR